MNNGTIYRYYCVVNDSDPPTYNHPRKSTNESLEQKQVAELDRYNRAPSQNKSNIYHFLELVCLLNEIARKGDIDEISGFGCANEVRIIDNTQEYVTGCYETCNTEEENAIIAGEMFSDVNPDIIAGAGADHAESEQNQTRYLKSQA